MAITENYYLLEEDSIILLEDGFNLRLELDGDVCAGFTGNDVVFAMDPCIDSKQGGITVASSRQSFHYRDNTLYQQAQELIDRMDNRLDDTEYYEGE